VFVCLYRGRCRRGYIGLEMDMEASTIGE